MLGRLLADPEPSFVAILGGAKISDKIGVIENLLGRVQTLLVGGGMANTFLRARGLMLGKSLVEVDKVDLARELLAALRARVAGVYLVPSFGRYDRVVQLIAEVRAASPAR